MRNMAKVKHAFFSLSLNHQRVLKCKEQNSCKRNSLLRAHTAKSCGVCWDGKRNTSAFAKNRQKEASRRSQQKRRQTNPDFCGGGWKRVRAEKSTQINSRVRKRTLVAPQKKTMWKLFLGITYPETTYRMKSNEPFGKKSIRKT